MELQNVFKVLVAASVVYLTGAFLPNNWGGTLPFMDYTLTDITEQGILRAVARYFEDTLSDRYNPRDLTGPTWLAPSSLYMTRYGDCGDSRKFVEAIRAIVKENVRISDDYASKAIWHFNGYTVNTGSWKIMELHNDLLDELRPGDVNTPDYDVSRKYCGQFLHMAHSFYSNTNWIELNRWLNSLIGEPEDEIITSSDLGVVHPLTWPENKEDVDMCQNCSGPITDPELQDCSNNLRTGTDTGTGTGTDINYYLTAGYRAGQDIEKPAATDSSSIWAKCSHGGINDASWTEVATGGINKETSDSRLSPHHYLHEQAALTAIQATEDFFYHPTTGLYALIGEEKFRRLLGLDVGSPLTFVIDVSGSMTDDIEGVKEITTDLVDKYAPTCFAPSNYVVVPFEDPAFGPAMVTEDPQECIDYLESLVAFGGGDCPELFYSGLEIGLQNSFDGQTVHIFTDASGKDREKVPDVSALIVKKGIIIKLYLTGTCSTTRRRKRGGTPGQDGTRATDWTKISPYYETIASISGGEIYKTDKAGIRELLQIIEGDIRASQVTITKRSSLNSTSLNMDIPVDSTTKEVLVSIVGLLNTDTVVLVNPQGVKSTPGDLGADIFTSSSKQTVFSINSTMPETKGNWVLKLQDLDLTTKYSVKVSANSFLGFTYDILEVDELGRPYPIDGFPVAGAEVLMLVQVSSPENVAVGEIRLYDSMGEETLLIAAAEGVTGRTEGLFTAGITVPNEPFFVSIVGADTQDFPFLRTQPAEVQVVKFKLEQIGTDTLDELFPGGNAIITFQVTNTGPSDSMTIRASVGANSTEVTASVEPSIMRLDTGGAWEGVLNVTVAPNAPIGTSVRITLIVESASSSAMNFMSFDATVGEEQSDIDVNPDEDDHTPPTCTILATGGGCTAEQMSTNCHLHEWWVRFRATDEVTITQIGLDPEVGDSQSLNYEEIKISDRTAKYIAPCCCPTIEITVKDGAGNMASCVQDYYTAVSNQTDKPVCNGPVNPDEDDHTPPTCTILATGGGCTAEQMSTNCHLHEWWVRFRATDEVTITEIGLDPEVGDSQSLNYEEFKFNDRTAKYTAPCCCPTIEITVKDGAGNMASCVQDYYTEVSNEIDKPECNGPVNPDEDDHTPPTCTILATGGGCAAEQMMSTNCHLHEWWVRFRATDEVTITEIGLDPEVGDSQSLNYEEFKINDRTAKYTAPCCCPMIKITVKDGAGNMASCVQDYYTEVSNEIDKPECNGPVQVPGDDLSTAAIIGIAVGSVAAAVAIGGVLVYCFTKSLGGGKVSGRVTPINAIPCQEPVTYNKDPQSTESQNNYHNEDVL